MLDNLTIHSFKPIVRKERGKDAINAWGVAVITLGVVAIKRLGSCKS